ncbi:ATP/GTP-binding protein [Streptomyces sp. NPDC002896]|uniref:ATP/GTP-binding protein n=1 Tax=Streptomyces sp. NPDC002896 TaxID=3154438 RepID=UPI003330B780
MAVCIGVGVDDSNSKPSGGGEGKPASRRGSPGERKCQTYSEGGLSNGDKNSGPGNVTVPCEDPELGSFSGGCYYKRADPQPPAGDPAWEGHEPGDGAIYQRSCPFGPPGNVVEGYVWMAQPPGAAAADPAQLAQEAVDKMTLRGPDIGITPKPGGKGVVGMPVWMWTEKSAETYGPQSASASAGGITVTATAKVSKIVWKLGDGATVTCTTAGTPYKAAYGKKDSPDCGHRYSQPSSTTSSGTYHVTATATWTIDWQGGGQTGQLTEVRDNAVDITVTEVQVLN